MTKTIETEKMPAKLREIEVAVLTPEIPITVAHVEIEVAVLTPEIPITVVHLNDSRAGVVSDFGN
jgi:hypothetical protein